MHGTFANYRVRLVDLSYSIDDLSIDKQTAAGARLPYFEVDRARFGLHWRELLRGHVVARLDLDRPRLNVVQVRKPSLREGDEPASGQQIEEVPKVGRRLRDLAPFLIDRAQVKDGELRILDARKEEQALLRLHGIELTIENFATRPALSKGEPTVLAARAVLQESGKVSVFATADPLAKGVTFAGQGRLEHLPLVEIQDLFDAHAKIEPEQGTLDMSVRFQAVNGKISGGVRPILKGVTTRPADKGLRAKLESLLADAALEIFEDDVPGREAVATTIPLSGTVNAPAAQAVPTVIGVLRNAFVRGLADSFSGLPPPKAEKREGVLEQARRGLSEKRGQPRAQPTPRDR
jgi:hypothetical protein